MRRKGKQTRHKRVTRIRDLQRWDAILACSSSTSSCIHVFTSIQVYSLLKSHHPHNPHPTPYTMLEARLASAAVLKKLLDGAFPLRRVVWLVLIPISAIKELVTDCNLEANEDGIVRIAQRLFEWILTGIIGIASHGQLSRSSRHRSAGSQRV
jgi:hypothetical protein